MTFDFKGLDLYDTAYITEQFTYFIPNVSKSVNSEETALLFEVQRF